MSRVRVAGFCVSLDGFGRGPISGGLNGAGCVNVLAGCHVCDFGGAVRTVFICVPRGWEISRPQQKLARFWKGKNGR